MNVLALDLATRTGWALWVSGRLDGSGVLDLSLKRGESPGMRFLRLRRWLREVLDGLVGPVVVACEQSLATQRGGHAAAVAHGLAAVLQEEVAERPCVETTAIHASSLKKHATGSGNAGKPAMVEAARARWGVEPADDNEADALCVLAWALSEIGEGS